MLEPPLCDRSYNGKIIRSPATGRWGPGEQRSDSGSLASSACRSSAITSAPVRLHHLLPSSLLCMNELLYRYGRERHSDIISEINALHCSMI